MSYIERYWRDAKPEDAIKDPPMVARFRDGDKLNWSKPCELRGWIRRNTYQWIGKSGAWAICQVYDAPDPGDGWRLIDSKSEQPIEGDEVWSPTEKIWKSRPYPERWFTAVDIYRRRIAPAVTYVPFTWEDREQLRGRIIVVTWENGAMQEFIAQHFTKTTDGRFEVAKVDADRLVKVGKFLDTGKPVGKEVTQ